MTPNLLSTQLQYQEEEIKFRLETIEECKLLLQSLNDGLYTIQWDGVFPTLKNQDRFKDRKIEIRVESKFKRPRSPNLRKYYITKNITICGNKFSCIESWTINQLIELNTKLVFI